ncbi:SAM-dependent methyltransferase [Nocardioides sp. MH1]|uniref:SAM-dependent methyltransferase n=1 Tax=Nocardioides sp. MH1 TaxID=3242490 RepID=UPI003522CB6A
MSGTDWSEWHDAYERAGSTLDERLDTVRAQVRRHLEATVPVPVRMVSLCAGDGRDVLGVLAGRDDADRVSGLLVELDPGLAERARAAAAALPARIEVRRADAALSDLYVDAAPADLVLLCGIFGNIGDDDVRVTIDAARQLCATGAEVIWTRHRGEPDLTPSIRRWFGEAGFEEVAFVAPEQAQWSVGVHRLTADPVALETGRRWFTFFR